MLCKTDQAQGGAQAIEDAIALAAVLPREATKLDEVPERLKLYETIRFERARHTQEYSRLAGQDRGDQNKAEKFDGKFSFSFLLFLSFHVIVGKWAVLLGALVNIDC